MKKVVFKGIINGKEFDNVQDYNAAMSKLIAQGATSIQASSETQIVDEDEKTKELDPNQNKNDVRLVKEVEPKFDVNDYHPYFNEGDEYYLDYLVSPDKELNEKNLKIAENTLKNTFEALHRALGAGRVSFDDAFDLINILKETRAAIKEDTDDNRAAIAQLTESIKRDEENLELLKYAKPVLGVMADYYDSAFALVKDYLLKY